MRHLYYLIALLNAAKFRRFASRIHLDTQQYNMQHSLYSGSHIQLSVSACNGNISRIICLWGRCKICFRPIPEEWLSQTTVRLPLPQLWECQ